MVDQAYSNIFFRRTRFTKSARGPDFYILHPVFTIVTKLSYIKDTTFRSNKLVVSLITEHVLCLGSLDTIYLCLGTDITNEF